MSSQVTIIDYGLGNLHSLEKAMEHLGAEVSVDVDGSAIADAERIIIPGVGAFPEGMNGMIARNQVDEVREFAASGRPVMGICLGCQLLLSTSEEFGEREGLGIIPGKVVPLPAESASVPHVGWSRLQINESGRSAAGEKLSTFTNGTWTYFVHSYHCQPADDHHRLAVCGHGDAVLTAAVGRDNILGFQFHPEKSSSEGLRMLEEFLQL